jgi:putative spermidine/putrescine transport system ATP-binding protein
LAEKTEGLPVTYLHINAVKKSFGDNTVVHDFSLAVGKGEFISLLGPSGCGKTTVLRMVAGFERPDQGRVLIDRSDMTTTKTSARNVGMVFQSYALFPNMTVQQNVAFGLRVKGMAQAEQQEQVKRMLDLVGLPQMQARYPYQLSGGQQQRVALARALAPHPRVLLLDEPLSALDAKIRVSLRQDIRAIQNQLGITTLFVTHDQEEAMVMSDRVVVMNAGVIEQVGTPEDIYRRPATGFVAKFVGSLNLVKDTTTGRTFGLRPEALHLGKGPRASVSLQGQVDAVSFMGAATRVQLSIAEEKIEVDVFNRSGANLPKPGEKSFVHFFAADAIALT